MISFARLTAALALAGAIISSPAYAAPAGEAMSVGVPTADLDLSSSAGRATLARRIGHAAGMVCGHPDAIDLIGTQATRTCRTQAIDDASQQVQLALAARDAGRRLAANSIAVTARAF
ncbi:UrcA family protein [Sphingomonas sp. MMS24-J13]|uniref:UrcA family protein n=1 Tax=Sphingomonas sp. MMS24-J13 TaxID=3238686 RepID=UPI00384D54A1